MIKDWLKTCEEEHDICNMSLKPDGPMAARLLQVLPEDCLRLVVTQDLLLHEQVYTVLSHVWGRADIECKTTRHKLDQYRVEIHYEDLPVTFREAIQITRSLGINYIWIDSLCIVQNDAQDWECESAKMSSIFRGAAMTISATTSNDCHEGCGINNTIEPPSHFPSVLDISPAFAIRGPEQLSYLSKIEQHMKNAPVHKRAWIFQEKHLSQRILHLTPTQFVWQCATRSESEDGFRLNNTSDTGLDLRLDSHATH
jgi:hypothetical protein